MAGTTYGDGGNTVRRSLLVAMVAIATVAAATILTQGAASAAPAQAAVCDPNAYPPTGPQIEAGLMLDASHSNLAHGANGTLTLTGAAPGGTYGGTVYSQSVPIPNAVADPSGVVRFQGVSVPSTFQLAAQHEVQITRDGCLVGDFTVCVSALGAVGPKNGCPTAVSADKGAGSGAAAAGGASGVLPHTGLAHLLELLRLAGLAVGLGAMLLYLRRRRLAALAH